MNHGENARESGPMAGDPQVGRILLARLLWYPHRVALLLAATFGIASWFYYSDVITKGIQTVAGFRVNPSFTGGLPSARLFDPVADDNGPGTLTYPKNDACTPGSLDLVRYTVFAPVWGGTWSASAEFWQLSIAFSGTGANARNARIYIDVDGAENGSTEAADDRAEGVTFDPEHPWDWRVALSGDGATFESADGTVSIPAEVYEANGGREVTVRVPLGDRRLHFLYTLPTTWHYVLVGAWTSWGPDGYAPVSRRAASGTGGGSTSAFTPRIYDLLDAPDRSQTAQLSAWDERTLSRPVVYPVEVSLLPLGEPKKRTANEALIARLAAAADRDKERDRAAKSEAYAQAEATLDQRDEASVRALAVAAFSAGEYAVAEKRFAELLTRTPDDAEALAYRGSLVAMKAQDENPLAAVETVTRAFADLDRACALAATADERIASLMNRASVSRAVPDIVFGKALAGAADYLAIAALLGTQASVGAVRDSISVLRAEALLGAAICFETAGRDTEAETWYRETRRLFEQLTENDAPSGESAAIEHASPDIPGMAAIALELARRGY